MDLDSPKLVEPLSPKDKKTKNFCGACEKKPAILFCDQCSTNYCQLCSSSYHSFNFSKSHVIKTLQEGLLCMAVCDECNNVDYVKYCNQCNADLCSTCSNSIHSFVSKQWHQK